MTSFLSGTAIALVLAAGTYFAMQAGTIYSVERIADRSHNLEGIDAEYSPATDTNPE
ncbi:hypothetical protein [Tranquillimonas alkanivorans]|uniref:Uncharacterized protein n=1 Tax=Tranquillimonas alkanivorans TaxID=441119 RepID=A0A1I5QDB4_9RHOB|nr:hypothetical protein [Tranquillimonas alkanivorans]SFP44299.1 hypothetical protein SAMN04488047_106188 [Tranquillimonas alkanivorans]